MPKLSSKRIMVVTTISLTSQALLASGGAEHHAPHIANWWTLTNQEAPALGWLIVTFVTFVALVYKFGVAKLQAHVAERHTNVKEAIEKARIAKEKAEAEKASFEARIAQLDDEISLLKNDFRAQGQKERDRLVSIGAKGAERILRDAEDSIAAKGRMVEKSLRDELLEKAFRIVDDKIASEVKAGDLSRLEGELGASISMDSKRI